MVSRRGAKDIVAWLNTLFANSVTIFLGLATGVILARSLGPAGRGELAAILIWPNLLAPIGLMGLDESVVYFLNSKKQKYEALLSNAIFIALVFSFIVIVIGVMLMPVLVVDEDYLPTVNAYLVVFVPFYYLLLVLMAFVQGRLDFKKYNLFQVAVPGLYLTGLVVLWAAGQINVNSALWASVFGVAVAAIMLLLFTPKGVLEVPSIIACEEIIKQGAKFHSSTIVTIISSQLDKLVVIKYFDSNVVGHYIIAYTFASAGLHAVAHAAHTVMFPTVSREKCHHKAELYLYRGIALMAVVLLIVSIVFAISSPWLLPRLFGSSYAEAVPLVSVLIAACVPLYIRQVVVRSLRGLGVSGMSFKSEVVALISFIVIVIPLLKEYGLSGVGYSLAISNTISLLMLLWAVKVNLFVGGRRI